ncbi:branched-chain amino acid ABC transporter substrate-binding protein [Mesorhizobium sp. L-8-10]|uniref:ABC transporter substrate-binding protein n=1 Tax=Mesorhizobium sp. L-8-10 TaxID=2744523 RepID=UPI0019291652|nr:ABC transporter substrate-binding protein [Mesorhizobium sp. L-8-10]BCH29693.1 branched-chain amino acid ABC transporter substrate-binding protein [Mesorhizobium sp. L-8-10]
MHLKSIVTGVLLAVGAFAAAIGGAEAAAKCGASTGQAASGEPIVIGGIVSIVGPADFSSSGKAAAAYFKCLNANGGINGRPVEYMLEDDGWNPEQASQVAAKLIKDKGAVALVGNMSFIDCGANQGIYEAEDIMVVAGVGVPRDCFFQKNYAPTNAGPRVSNTKALIDLYNSYPGEIKKVVCFAPNIPNVGEWSCNGAIEWIKSKGGDGMTIAFDPGSMDATSLVLQAMAFEPDVISVSTPKEIAVPIFAAAEEQDLADKVHWMGPASLYNPDFPTAIGDYWNGKVTVDMEMNAADAGTPDMDNWLAVMDEYGSSSDPRDTFSQAGYLAARVTAETLMKLDPAKIDRPTVTAALRGVTRFESDIFCKPWYIGDAPRHNANNSGPVAMVKDGKLVAKPGCIDAEDPELADVHEYEKKIGIRQ